MRPTLSSFLLKGLAWLTISGTATDSAHLHCTVEQRMGTKSSMKQGIDVIRERGKFIIQISMVPLLPC